MIENFESIVASSIFTRLGWTMLHSIWLLALLGIAILFVLSRLRNSTANLRYSCGYFGLCLMMATPVIAFCFVGETRTAETPIATADTNSTAEQPVDSRPNSFHLPDEVIDEGTGEEFPAPRSESVAADKPDMAASSLFDELAPWLSLLWLGGIACLSFWHLGGWWTACRMCKIGTSAVGPGLDKTLRELKTELEIKSHVFFKESSIASVPVVIGWLKPTVLIPMQLIEQLSGVQLRMVIAHELAHIRRHDYLANLIQTTIDTLLFFHPMAWWVSRQVRLERENCCDDLAVERCGESVDLARAIVAIESARSERISSSVVAATGGDTKERVYRLLGHSNATPRRNRPLPILSIAALFVLALFFFSDNKSTMANDKQPEWGPIQDGLQMRLTVENRTGADENIHRVTIEIANRRDEPIQFQIPWDSLGGDDWTGFVRANTAFKCNPLTPEESFQTAAGFETGPKFLPAIEPGASIKVSWIEPGKTLGHAQGYPRFNRSGGYDVTAAINLLPKDAKEEIMLTSNSQRYVMGGSDEKPLKGICKLSKVNLKNSTAQINVGSNDLLKIGDRFSKRELGSHWKFTIIETRPNSSTVKFETLVGEPRENVTVPLDLERLEIKHNRKTTQWSYIDSGLALGIRNLNSTMKHGDPISFTLCWRNFAKKSKKVYPPSPVNCSASTWWFEFHRTDADGKTEYFYAKAPKVDGDPKRSKLSPDKTLTMQVALHENWSFETKDKEAIKHLPPGKYEFWVIGYDEPFELKSPLPRMSRPYSATAVSGRFEIVK